MDILHLRKGHYNMETIRIGFIGLGLIGGSIAKAIKKFHPEYQLAAHSSTSSTLDFALQEGIIDERLTKFDKRFSACDYIFLCAPVSTNIEYLPFLKGCIKPTCIITDVGSVKGGIHRAVTQIGLEDNFIGGHPMTGSEKTGIKNATDYLLENSYYIITPAGSIAVDRLSAYMELIFSLGAIPMVLTYDEHDLITAAVSHLPHIIASTLVNLIHNIDTDDEHMRTIAAGGFKDITRIASSSAEMWQPICSENRQNISRVLDEYIRLLVQARCWIDQNDKKEIYDMFDQAREYRNALPDSSHGPLKRNYILYCDIYDEAGGIATIATLLAMNNINIKNIGIVHNREFEAGVLSIEFYDEAAITDAQRVLADRNYTIHIR